MEVPYIESAATSMQAEAIAARLSECSIRNRVIYNPYEEAVAVHVPEAITAKDAMANAFRAAAFAPLALFAEESAEQHEFVQRRLANVQAARTVPSGLHSGSVYYVLQHVIDCAVEAATDRKQLGTDLFAYETGGGDAAAHIDFPGSHANPGPDELHGLNIHLTLTGQGEARFGLLREFQSAVTLAEGIGQARQNGLSSAEVNRYLAQGSAQETDPRIPTALQEGVASVERAMQQASEPVELHPGDVVIFQARQHQAKGLLPTVHQFTTIQQPRWYTVFTPKGAPRTEVIEDRNEILVDHLMRVWPDAAAYVKEKVERLNNSQ